MWSCTQKACQNDVRTWELVGLTTKAMLIRREEQREEGEEEQHHEALDETTQGHLAHDEVQGQVNVSHSAKEQFSTTSVQEWSA